MCCFQGYHISIVILTLGQLQHILICGNNCSVGNKMSYWYINMGCVSDEIIFIYSPAAPARTEWWSQKQRQCLFWFLHLWIHMFILVEGVHVWVRALCRCLWGEYGEEKKKEGLWTSISKSSSSFVSVLLILNACACTRMCMRTVEFECICMCICMHTIVFECVCMCIHVCVNGWVSDGWLCLWETVCEVVTTACTISFVSLDTAIADDQNVFF